MLVGRVDSSGELYQYFHDGLGSITMICDSTGSYQNLYTYDDFGDFRKKDESVSNSYCYTGQERDEEPSGLYNLRARYYAVGMGRFTQEDPVFGIAGLAAMGSCGKTNIIIDNLIETNLYLYAFNNPMRYTDIMGLDPCEDLWRCLKKIPIDYEKRRQQCLKNAIDCVRDPCKSKAECIEGLHKCHRIKEKLRFMEERECKKRYKWRCFWYKIGDNIPIPGLPPFFLFPEQDDGVPRT